ncbi:hypothetical protein BDR04DRAFT_1143544 [Suillus decipiens]|nr:hypothetical protein BDR04DRAFT_1143544 [Suillus decipiens]
MNGIRAQSIAQKGMQKGHVTKLYLYTLHRGFHSRRRNYGFRIDEGSHHEIDSESGNDFDGLLGKKAGEAIEEARAVCEKQGWTVAVSRDGRWVVTGGDSGELKACEVETGIDINAINICAENTLLASGSDDEIARIWNLETEKLVAGPFNSIGQVGAIRFSKKLAVKIGEIFLDKQQNHHRLIAAFEFTSESDDPVKTILECDASTLEIIGAPFESLAFSLDGALLANAKDDCKIYICDIPPNILAQACVCVPCTRLLLLIARKKNNQPRDPLDLTQQSYHSSLPHCPYLAISILQKSNFFINFLTWWQGLFQSHPVAIAQGQAKGAQAETKNCPYCQCSSRTSYLRLFSATPLSSFGDVVGVDDRVRQFFLFFCLSWFQKKQKKPEPRLVYDDPESDEEEDNVLDSGVQHEEIALKPLANQLQPEAGPSSKERTLKQEIEL